MPSQNAFPHAGVGRFNSHLREGAKLDVLDEEAAWEIEQVEQPEESSDSSGSIDVLCLETACLGVLTTLWCELTNYAKDYAVPKAALRAMVQCCFLAELDEARFWAEEDGPKPLTREKYLKVLERARKAEEVRIQHARQRYRVPDEKWRVLLAKAGRLSGVTDGQSDRQGG